MVGWLIGYAVFHLLVSILVFACFYNMYTHHTHFSEPPTIFERRVHYTTFVVVAMLGPLVPLAVVAGAIWDVCFRGV